MNKLHIALLLGLFASFAKAQTNIQAMYDFNRL